MKKNNYKKISLILLGFIIQHTIWSQCATTTLVGASTNMFTQIRNGTNPVAADKNLNTIVFAHRNNASVFGGNSGHIRYDVSTNAGLTWSTNIGPLNPSLNSPARYPNALIYNPVANLTPTAAYVGYLAATINSVSSAWNGVVTGVRQLSGTGNTESYNQPNPNTSLIAHSVVKGAPGVFWSVDAAYNGTLVTGFNIYKGEWGVSDINWATNFTVAPTFNIAYDGTGHVGDYNIAFDPTGTKGWMSFLGHISPGPTNYAYYPVFYKTIDGGATWTGPIQVDLNQFSCITPNITTGNVMSTAFEHDLVVDINGNPHMLTTICNGANAYSVYFSSWHHMFDITQLNGVWAAYDIANVNAGRGTWGTAPNAVSMDMEPQAARTADGKKLFFSWSDNASYGLGAANQLPNMFSKAFDVQTNKWTALKDFTSCNAAVNGKVLFPHMAEEVLEPTSTSFKFASVYGEYTVANDPAQVSNFRFLDGTLYSTTDFTVAQLTASVSIQQGSSWLLCPTNTLGLSINGTYNQVLWSDATITNSTTASAPGVYIVTVRNGCIVGADTITVTGLTTTALASSTAICTGGFSTLTVNGNAYSYTFTPGSITATTTVVSPTASTVYSVAATGDGACVYTKTVSVNVNALPTLTVAGSGTVCSGSSVTQTVSGAATYTWSSAANGSTVVLSPTVNTTYTVTGTDGNACVNSQTVSIIVNAQPTITATSSNATICVGQSATLTAGGAVTYSWNTAATTTAIVVSPSVTTSYSVTGTSALGCSKVFTVSQPVSACLGLQELSAIENIISVFPNPNNGSFTINLSSVSESTYMEVYNLTGQLILREKASGLTHLMNMNEKPSGIYYVLIFDNRELKRKANFLKQ